MKKRMQSLPARILFLLFLLFDADELVVLVFDGLLDISVCDCLAHGEDGSTFSWDTSALSTPSNASRAFLTVASQ